MVCYIILHVTLQTYTYFTYKMQPNNQLPKGRAETTRVLPRYELRPLGSGKPVGGFTVGFSGFQKWVVVFWLCQIQIGKCVGIWGFPKIVGFPPKSSILIGFSIIFTIQFGVPLFLETHIDLLVCVCTSLYLSLSHLFRFYYILYIYMYIIYP